MTDPDMFFQVDVLRKDKKSVLTKPPTLEDRVRVDLRSLRGEDGNPSSVSELFEIDGLRPEPDSNLRIFEVFRPWHFLC